MAITKSIETASLSISGVRSTLTKDEANTLMNTIIAKNIFKTNSGDFLKNLVLN